MANEASLKFGTNFRQRVKSRFVAVDAGSGSVNSDQQRRRPSLVEWGAAQLDVWLVILGSRVSNDGVARWSNSVAQLAEWLVVMVLRTDLKSSFQKVLLLVAVIKALEKDMEHPRINLHIAEDEVKLLYEEDKVLDVENKRLLRLYQKKRNHSASGG